MDIYPTLAHLMGYEKPFRSWGRSLLSHEDDEAPYVINFFGASSYYIMDKTYICIHDGEKAIGFYHADDNDLKNNLIENPNKAMDCLAEKLEMFLQSYMNRIIEGNMHHEEESFP